MQGKKTLFEGQLTNKKLYVVNEPQLNFRLQLSFEFTQLLTLLLKE